MPYYCRSRVSQALNHGAGKSLSASRILVLGVAYKADISDMRESPAVKLIELLANAGAEVSYHDPFVPSFTEHGVELASVPLEPAAYDAVVIATAHSSIDYAWLADEAEPGRRPAQRDGPCRNRRREGLEAVTVRVGQAGLGHWGRNLVRNFDELTELAWLCDTDEELRARFAERHPQARVTGDFDQLLADDSARRDRRRHARADALRAREAGAPRRQARVRREAARHEGPRDGGARRPGAATGAAC